MTREEVVQRVGALRYGRTSNRRTTKNDYRIDIFFSADRTRSQFHPTDRVRSVEFVVDHPSTAAAILDDLPEATELCRNGCVVIAVQANDSYAFGPHLVVYMAHPTANDLDVAARSRVSWRQPATEGNWTPAMILTWDSDSPDSRHPARPINWLSQPAQRVLLTSVEPQREMEIGSQEKAALVLGTWKHGEILIHNIEAPSTVTQVAPPAPSRAAVLSAKLGETVYPAGSGIAAPRGIYTPDPEFTELARRDKISGVVKLEVVVGADGIVKNVETLESLRPDLDANAVRVVKTWRFEPARKDGIAVAVLTNIEVEFRSY